jgi:uncharacterized protein with HEPN domain
MKDDRLYLIHILVHDYLGVDVERVWNIVQNDLPVLKRAVSQMLGPKL